MHQCSIVSVINMCL